MPLPPQSNTMRLRVKSDIRLSDAVYETLLEAILRGRLATGEVVSEVALAQKLQVSRTPVHDALRQLAKDGLVRQEANRRAVIASFTAEDIYDIFEMRKILEGEAARRAATRIGPQVLAELRRMMGDLKADPEAPNWITRWADFDDAFHSAIAAAAGSPRLAQDISRYRMLHRGINKLSTTVEALQQAMAEHEAILEALDARNAKASHAAMINHLQGWQAYFVRHFRK